MYKSRTTMSVAIAITLLSTTLGTSLAMEPMVPKSPGFIEGSMMQQPPQATTAPEVTEQQKVDPALLLSKEAKTFPTYKVISYIYTKDKQVMPMSLGSATLISSTGLLLTNNHVVEDSYDITKTYDVFQVCKTSRDDVVNSTCTTSAHLIDRNRDLDIALLQIDPTNIDGNTEDFSHFLPLEKRPTLGINKKISVIGYPDNGGESITVTSGQISGISNEGQATYYKTDSLISSGNSGGTALDDNGNFIGIPTFVRIGSTFQNLGYILPIGEAFDWVEKVKGQKTQVAEEKRAALLKVMKRYNTANTTHTFTQETPAYAISIPENWEFQNTLEDAFSSYGSYYGISNDSVNIKAKKQPVFINIQHTKWAYPITIDNLWAEERRNNPPSPYTNDTTYKAEDVMLNGKYKALRITQNFGGGGELTKSVEYRIPFGRYEIFVRYTLSDQFKDLGKDIDMITGSFKLDEKKIDTGYTIDIVGSDPYFKFRMPKNSMDWYVSEDPYYTSDPALSLSFTKKDDFDSYAYITYYKYPEELKGQDLATKFAYYSSNYQYSSVTNKGNEISLDGKPGFFFTTKNQNYGSRGENDPLIDSYIYVDDGDYYYQITLHSGSNKFEKLSSELMSIISEGVDLIPNSIGLTNLPTLSYSLKDIENHRFEKAITGLFELKVLKGYEDGTFRPNAMISRSEFLVLALKSLKQGKIKEDLDTYMADTPKEGMNLSFADIKADDWYAPYVSYAAQKNIIGGYKDKSGRLLFEANKQITLAEGLSILFKTRGIPLWKDPFNVTPWQLPVMEKAIEYNLLPVDMLDSVKALTRAEAAWLTWRLTPDGAYYSAPVYSGY